MTQTAHAYRHGFVPRLNTDQLRMERRRWARRVVESGMTAIFSMGERRGVLPITVLDVSVDGLGAISPTDLPPGTRISLCANAVPVPARTGTVVRCVEDHGRFQIGVRLDAKLCA